MNYFSQGEAKESWNKSATEILDLCDELGLLVYEEPYDKWTGGSYRSYFETDCKQTYNLWLRVIVIIRALLCGV
ncbi:hypothetical protein [Paenibacillus sp. RC67]|uniref:hypothetical protein n=1 Tax=Paenibacillus sp. RC67 TaxID=3039392 RepID=UPI0024ADD9AD|nr:hypothetical protein [Paenibacillus sp. RC67]